MNFEEYQKQFQAELIRLIAQREELDKKIQGLTKAIDGLSVATGKGQQMAPPPDLVLVPGASGFTDRVRAALRSDTGKSWTPTQIRDVLVKSGIEDTKQMLVQVHNTLDRLVKQDEVRPDKDGYKWITPIDRVLSEIINQRPDVPNPFGRNLAEMLSEPGKKR